MVVGFDLNAVKTNRRVNRRLDSRHRQKYRVSNACDCRVCVALDAQLSKHTEAVADFSKALSDDPTYTKAYERRAASYYELGECWCLVHVFREL